MQCWPTQHHDNKNWHMPCLCFCFEHIFSWLHCRTLVGVLWVLLTTVVIEHPSVIEYKIPHPRFPLLPCNPTFFKIQYFLKIIFPQRQENTNQCTIFQKTSWKQPLVDLVYVHFLSIWVFPNIMVPPNHPLKNRVFHYFHHPFWGIPLFLETPISNLQLPQNGWFIRENPMYKWMIWGENPPFSETPI